MSENQRLIKRAALDYRKVRLLGEDLLNSRNLELDYLEKLEADKLLAGFREIAGLPAKASLYGGWEVLEIRGHTLGHYLTALSQAYEETGLLWLKERISYIVSELFNCQAEDGYLFASERDYFDRVEKKMPVWVPWYTMHKIMQGLLAAYRAVGLEKNLTILKRLGGWVSARCDSWSEETHKTVLSIEYGGMNECLYDLYQIWPEPAILRAAEAFDELPLFEKLHDGIDILEGLHANTTIPKVIGALKRYLVLGESEHYYRETAEQFWEMVVSGHTYLTGGNSEWEHFGKPGLLAGKRTACNCETCNSYNMLKLTRLLYQITGKPKYAAFYERAFLNSILSSQNKETGMTTYFQPMATGYYKVFGTPFDRFWCCTGTGMENFTKLTEGIYYENNKTLYLNLFLSSEVIVKSCNAVVTVIADLLKEGKMTISVKRLRPKQKVSETLKIAVRMPEWLDQAFLPEGEAIWMEDQKEPGYVVLSKNWETKPELELKVLMKLQAHPLPDQEEVIGFTYGPYVLSADLGSSNHKIDFTGIEVYVPTMETPISEEIQMTTVSLSELKHNPADCFRRLPDQAGFEFIGGYYAERLIFTPHYLQDINRYGIYFRFMEDTDKK